MNREDRWLAYAQQFMELLKPISERARQENTKKNQTLIEKELEEVNSIPYRVARLEKFVDAYIHRAQTDPACDHMDPYTCYCSTDLRERLADLEKLKICGACFAEMQKKLSCDACFPKVVEKLHKEVLEETIAKVNKIEGNWCGRKDDLGNKCDCGGLDHGGN